MKLFLAKISPMEKSPEKKNNHIYIIFIHTKQNEHGELLLIISRTYHNHFACTIKLSNNNIIAIHSLNSIRPFDAIWNHDFIFVFVTIYWIMTVEQCNRHRNMRHENSQKTAIKKTLLLKYFRRKLIQTDKKFFTEMS